MNAHTTLAGLLLAALSAGAAAQELSLKTLATPKQLIASVDGTDSGSVVVLVLGLREGPALLPNGQLLGISADVLAGWAIGDALHPSRFVIDLAPALDLHFVFFAQAVSFDPTWQFEDQWLKVSQVRRVEVTQP